MGGDPSSFPDCDHLALALLCNRQARQRAFQELRAARGAGHIYPNTVRDALCRWVATRPAPGAANALFDELTMMVLAATGPRKDQDLADEAYFLASVAVQLEAAPHEQSRALLQLLVVRREAQFAGREPQSDDFRWTELDHLGARIAEVLLFRLNLADPEDRALAEQCIWLFTGLPAAAARAPAVADRLAAVAGRWVAEPGAREADARMLHVIRHLNRFRGFDRFLGACRQLSRHPKAKPPLSPNFEIGVSFTPIAWAVWVLLHLEPPTPADTARAAELNLLPADSLITAALFAPGWAALAEPHLAWPGFAAACRWLQAHGETGHWRGYRPGGRYGNPGSPADDEAEGADREAALALIAAMGEARYLKLLKHPVARSKYKDGLFYLQACRGENAADVEAGFAKRNRAAVRALGLLPDKGDILQRYLALRRFAKEARQFGAQRQASELQLVDEALANLAITAGYNDAAQLEWAMEGQLAEQVDPAGRRWQIGGYTITLEDTAQAAIVTERDGARLKAMPDAIRKAPEYQEIKEARELLQAQWERIRRRLEVAMVTGEVMDRQTFLPALTTPAGRSMVPALVLRCMVGSSIADVLDFRTLTGDMVDPAAVDAFRVVHPLDLDEAAKAAWRSQLKARGLTQPFEQLFRATYAHGDFRGRQVRLGTFKERLKRQGWKPGYEGELTRRLRAGAHAAIWFADGAAYQGALEVLTLGDLRLQGALTPLELSEVCRDIDLASTAAAPDKVPN